MDLITFTLEPVAPFRLDLTVWALRRRPENAVDRWDGNTYRRVLSLREQPLEVAVVQSPDLDGIVRAFMLAVGVAETGHAENHSLLRYRGLVVGAPWGAAGVVASTGASWPDCAGAAGEAGAAGVLCVCPAGS